MSKINKESLGKMRDMLYQELKETISENIDINESIKDIITKYPICALLLDKKQWTHSIVLEAIGKLPEMIAIYDGHDPIVYRKAVESNGKCILYVPDDVIRKDESIIDYALSSYPEYIDLMDMRFYNFQRICKSLESSPSIYRTSKRIQETKFSDKKLQELLTKVPSMVMMYKEKIPKGLVYIAVRENRNLAYFIPEQKKRLNEIKKALRDYHQDFLNELLLTEDGAHFYG